MSNIYTKEFYQNQQNGSYIAAKHIIPIIKQYLDFNTVIDVGCGVGTWRKAFNEFGCYAYGCDGRYALEAEHYFQEDCFFPIDLENQRFNVNMKCDLAISLEVAEHLSSERALTFVEDMTNLADVIVFSAAIPGQGGTNHINEQPMTYWLNLFSKFDFVPVDCIRPLIWNNKAIEVWYRQNIILLIKKDKLLSFPKIFKYYLEHNDSEIYDIIHPEFFRAFRF